MAGDQDAGLQQPRILRGNALRPLDPFGSRFRSYVAPDTPASVRRSSPSAFAPAVHRWPDEARALGGSATPEMREPRRIAQQARRNTQLTNNDKDKILGRRSDAYDQL